MSRIVDKRSRQTDAAAHDEQMLARVVLVLAVVGVALVLGLWWRARQGAVRAVGDVPAGASSGHAVPWREHGVDLGSDATFVQFSTEFCSPCRQTARVLHGLAGARDGVVHAELDIDTHLDLVRELSVLRAPTVVVLDASGTEVARMSGAVSRAQAEQALGVVAHAA